MKSLELATWVLTGFTGILTIATSVYAFITYKMFKSSEENQKLLEDQNSIISSHNNLLREQTEALHQQAKALFQQSDYLRHIPNAISNLPFDAQEITNKIEKNRNFKK